MNSDGSTSPGAIVCGCSLVPNTETPVTTRSGFAGWLIAYLVGIVYYSRFERIILPSFSQRSDFQHVRLSAPHNFNPSGYFMPIFLEKESGYMSPLEVTNFEFVPLEPRA